MKSRAAQKQEFDKVLRAMLMSKPRGRPKTLTRKDIDVLKGKVMSGMTQGRIAMQYGLSRQTISKYVAENLPVGGQ